MNTARKILSREKEVELVGLDQGAPLGYDSFFSSNVWNFFDPSKERQNSIELSKLRIEWYSYENKMPRNLLIAIKVITYYFLQSEALRKRYLSHSKFKPQTFCSCAKNLLRLFAIIVDDHRKISNVDLSIFQITATQLQEAIGKYDIWSHTGICHLLTITTDVQICNAIKIITNEEGSIKWTINDVDVLDFPLRVTKKHKYNGSEPRLPDELVNFLIQKASSDVLNFLRRLDLHQEFVTSEQDSGDFDSNSFFLFNQDFDLKSAMQDYLNIRQEGIKYYLRKGSRSSMGSVLSNEFKDRHHISVNDFKHKIVRVQNAARYLVMQFTGARYGEVISFKVGCLQEKHDEYYLQGTVVKGKSDQLITGTDYWVAIPIVRASVKVLEILTLFSQQFKLFASSHGAVLNVSKKGLSNKALTDLLNIYLYSSDSERLFTKEIGNGLISDLTYRDYVKPEFVITPHRIRHTLMYQFFRQGANLAVSSFHFKHAYFASKVYNIPNEVTLGYGNMGNEMFKHAQYAQEVKEEIVNSIYALTAPVAGAGAKKFIERRLEFFNGEFKKGKTESQILKELCKRKLPYADVVTGFCGGKDNFIDDEGEEVQPPCIGQLKCNPVRCKNAIIPKVKEPHWRALRDANMKLLANPRMSHAADTLKSVIMEAETVIEKLSSNGTR